MEVKIVRLFQTSKDNRDRLTEKPLLTPGSNVPQDFEDVSIMIDLNKQYQEIEGFGGAFTEATAVTDHGQPEAAEAIRSGDLPDLDEMKQRTDDRAAEVQAILEQSE